jgi:hypothetical protein
VQVLPYTQGESLDTLRKVSDTLKKYDGKVVANVVVLQHDNLHLQIAFHTSIEVS